MNLREQFKTSYKEFEVVSLGGQKLKFKKVNGLELASLFDWQRTVNEQPNVSVNDLYWKARIVASSMLSGDGTPIYTTEQADLDELVKIDPDVFAELYTIAGRLIGFVAPEQEEQVAEEGEVAAQQKN